MTDYRYEQFDIDDDWHEIRIVMPKMTHANGLFHGPEALARMMQFGVGVAIIACKERFPRISKDLRKLGFPTLRGMPDAK